MAEDLQHYIYEHIPIVKDNKFHITVDSKQRIIVAGDYRDHINHRNSVFGGSLGTALTLAAWAFVRQILLDNAIADAVVVIQSQQVQFLHPVTKDFYAVAEDKPVAEKHKLVAMLDKFSKSRITIVASVSHCDETEVLARFSGEFVVVRQKT